MRRISKAGLDEIKQWESFVPFWYDDLKPARGQPHGYREWNGEAVVGTLTIGYGHTAAARHPLKPEVGKRISEAEAVEILNVDLDECEADVNRLVKVPISQGQFDALVSFQFNSGALGKSTLLKRLNRGEYDAVPSEMLKWVSSKGRRLQGLVNRRNAEIALWNSSEAVDDEVTATRRPDKPQPEDFAKSRTVQGAGLAALGGAAAVVQETKVAVEDAKSNYSTGDVFGVVIAALILIGAGYALYARWRDGGGVLPWER